LGVDIISLPADEALADEVFVEDTAVVLNEVAVITRPGAESRRGETVSIAKVLSAFRKIVKIEPPATLDGGDVLVIGKKIYIGLSSRSNIEGLQQMETCLTVYGYELKGVEVHNCLHLKSAVTQVSDHLLLINPVWIDKSHFEEFERMEVDPSEPYAANGLLICNQLIYPDAYPKTLAKLQQAGIKVIMLDISEIAKAEGAVTCCSLVFQTNQ
jgi:dimethylargininase